MGSRAGCYLKDGCFKCGWKGKNISSIYSQCVLSAAAWASGCSDRKKSDCAPRIIETVCAELRFPNRRPSRTGSGRQMFVRENNCVRLGSRSPFGFPNLIDRQSARMTLPVVALAYLHFHNHQMTFFPQMAHRNRLLLCAEERTCAIVSRSNRHACTVSQRRRQAPCSPNVDR